MANLRYFDDAIKPPPENRGGIYTDYLRTGRINRGTTDARTAKRYLTHQQVAERTGRRLEAAGTLAYDRINGFHASIRFPKMIFHRTLDGSPHLGYCHVTAARSKFAEYDEVRWSFYMANFFCEIGKDDHFFDDVRRGYSRMYFAVATDLDREQGKLVINRTVRDGGLLFRTQDPKTALKNVLMLGARNDALRAIIRAL
ncbi:DUF6656 family protein [Rhizobium sp. Leaf341]|uniref:DUF6656 family protein n=1 Tax=Rhizobium sp. Leaf341 TaxID=1736344 RepID=UPI000712747C|nr:DUF6656 family protein [Rhizobium sp. Leaf341]KQR78241.1 hypothetical protein ASG03_13560 [Rhizobium sp. Leaf341]